jgi:two-component system LytT family sensor kinase
VKKIIVQIIIHIAAWACFLMLPFAFYPHLQGDSFFELRNLTAFFIVNSLFIIAFYYLNTHLIIPRLLDQKKFLAYSLLIIALLVFYGCMPQIYRALFGPIGPVQPPRPGPPRVRPLVSAGNIAVFLLVFVFSTGLKVINQWLRSEQRNKEIANEKLKAELSFLKAQINPHFLFNTLNNIYALASAQSERTAAAVMKLSSIMRYVLTEARNDLVPLEKEILFTSHYIELQKMRLTDKTIIDFEVKGDPTRRQIAPLLLLPFVENAFKYGVSTRELSPIRIELEITAEWLYFRICNQKHINTSIKVTDNTGIGISNTQRRLDLFYEDRYELNIDDKANEFSVHLKIPV